MRQPIYQIILKFFLLIVVSGCTASKKDLQLENAFKKYLATHNIQYEKSDSIYSKYYSDFLKNETKKALSANVLIKLNKIYLYEGPDKITFCIFSDDGREYLSRNYKNDDSFIIDPENGIVKLKQTVKLEFLGNFQLTDTVIKISRNMRELSGKESNQCDLGILQKDTIKLIENYDTKKYNYKKKWLTKTYRTNYKLIYQPNLKATRYEGNKNYNPFYLIEGSFTLEDINKIQ